VFVGSGKRATGMSPVEWAKKCEELGAGEILLNSINRDGSRMGYDTKLLRSVVEAIKIPVIACGGVGRMDHFSEGVLECGADAVAAANIFQHSEHSTILAKAHMLKSGIDVRLDSLAKYDSREFDENGRLLMLSTERLLDVDLRKK
jgi:cyclase